MTYMNALWNKITTSYSKWPPLARTQSLCLCGYSSIELRNTSTRKSAAAFRRDSFKLSILRSLFLQAISWVWTTIYSPRDLVPDLQKANLKRRWSLEHMFPATAGLSVPCVLEPSPAGSSSSVHGRGCCKKRHPNIESLRRSLRKAAADFPVDVLRNSIDEDLQRLKDCVRANGSHFK